MFKEPVPKEADRFCKLIMGDKLVNDRNCEKSGIVVKRFEMGERFFFVGGDLYSYVRYSRYSW